ncbi:MAG: 30S ribosomal protein S9 [Candidatus Gracilibacteria bacterium]|nr:30S ribosomal protein S9 [Candidatus Gracilibacteria bacterium]
MANYIYTIGRRKTATAQIKLFEGAGKNTINGKDAKEYITRNDLFDVLYSGLKLCGVKDSFYFDVKVEGSGISSQIQAIRLGLSRALSEKDEKFKKSLKDAGFLTRDARKVERKKPGLHKARKASQWSKR